MSRGRQWRSIIICTCCSGYVLCHSCGSKQGNQLVAHMILSEMVPLCIYWVHNCLMTIFHYQLQMTIQAPQSRYPSLRELRTYFVSTSLWQRTKELRIQSISTLNMAVITQMGKLVKALWHCWITLVSKNLRTECSRTGSYNKVYYHYINVFGIWCSYRSPKDSNTSLRDRLFCIQTMMLWGKHICRD